MTSCGSGRVTHGGIIALSHRIEQSTDDYEDTEFRWLTKMDLYLERKALESPEMKSYCDKLM